MNWDFDFTDAHVREISIVRDDITMKVNWSEIGQMLYFYESNTSATLLISLVYPHF